MNTKFKIDQTSIVDVLMKKSLRIPVYQRNYSWKEEHVTALIDDIISRAADESEHYFGVIALTKTTTSINGEDITISKVIDGQQRLTTSLLILFYLIKNSKTEDINLIEYIKYNNKNVKFQHEMNNSSLEENINNLLLENYNSLLGRFGDNYKIIVERLKDYSPDYINKLLECFKNKFIVAILDYDIDRDEEMLVFENLNSKGSPLKPFDLIRNHILSMCVNDPQSNLQEFQRQIINLTSTKYKRVASSDGKREDKLEKFMNWYLIFVKGDSLKKYTNYSVYKNFKTVFASKKKMDEDEFNKFLYRMRKFAILFLSIETNQGIGNNIWLRTLSNKDNHMFLAFCLFELFGKFDDENEEWIINDKIDEYLKVVAGHVLKTMSVQGTGQSFTNMYISIMKLIKNDNATPKQLSHMLKVNEVPGTQATPTSTEFTNSLLSSPKQRWIPGAIIDILEERAYRKNPSNERVNYVEKSIEHILPQKAKEKDWPFITGHDEEYKQTLNMIGNLLYFNKSANSSLGNKAFIKKLETYKKSKSPLVLGDDLNIEALTKNMVFTFETIKSRTEKLIKELIKELK